MTTFKKILKQFEKDHYDEIHFPVKQEMAKISQTDEALQASPRDLNSKDDLDIG